MQTQFTAEQLADPELEVANDVLRTCVHCGMCTATCPTYVLLGDELDSPRGRIYLMKDMLENDKPATANVVKHIDRCLSCLSCMTTCPSGVHYMHLVDHARIHIANTYKRPLGDRALRWLLSIVVPYPFIFRLSLLGAMIGRYFAWAMPRKLQAMMALAPKQLASPSAVDRPQVFSAVGPRRKRVALMGGCAQQALRPSINEATVRLLTRHGVEVVVVKGAGCCGAAVHHMGMEEPALKFTRANVKAWYDEYETDGLDAIVVNVSGCGTSVKDYGFMLREDPEYAEKAAKVSALTKDVSEFMVEIGLDEKKVNDAGIAQKPVVAYHSACSMQHGQKLTTQPYMLLADAGFEARGIAEAHFCCGSAGTYNVLQPDIADQLKERKVRNLEAVEPDVIATGNIGCIVQIQGGTQVPVVHTVELLDWATGGPVPVGMETMVR